MGGGLAGCFAAVRARELNASVTLVEKNFTGKTGWSHYAGVIMLFNEKWGDDIEAWVDEYSRVWEYLVDRRWAEGLLRESYHRYRDMVSWGIPFTDKEGKIGYPDPEKDPRKPLTRLKSKYRYTLNRVDFGKKWEKMLLARKKVIESGCNVLDRVMITDLLRHDGRVVGAVGFHTRNGDFYVIKAKATVIATGGMHFRGAAYGRQFTTGDGQAMAYRAGGELMNMEFGGLFYVAKQCDSVVIDGTLFLPPQIVERDRTTNAYGEEFLNGNPGLVTTVLWPIEVHAGRGPIYHEPFGIDREPYKEEIKRSEKNAELPCITMLDRAGIDIFKDRIEQYVAFMGTSESGAGLRINDKSETNVMGLYAAGNSSGDSLGAANYSAGTGMMKASVTGYRAGENAAKYAKRIGNVEIDGSEIEKYREIIFAPLNRKGGYTTDHVLTRIQQTIFPYEVHMVMHEKRLQAALTMIEFFRDHFIPKMTASDIHDLRKAHEVRNMVLGAEMMLRAAIVRTESRGWFYREDYPRRDDENWLKWIVLKEETGEMKIWTVPVQKEYWGDTSMPYEKRYPLNYER